MFSANFTTGSKSQDIRIDSKDIVAYYDKLRSYLKIPIIFTFHLPTEKDTYFDVLSIGGKLISGNNNILSEQIGLIGQDVYVDKQNYTYTFSFPLEYHVLNFFEKNRIEDANFSIGFDIVLLFKSIIPNFHSVGIHVLREIKTQKFNTSIKFSIPQSSWLKILDDLGYGAFKIIEIPTSHKMLKEAYDGIIDEFNKAEGFYKKNDFNNCVAHCRNAMDKLTRNLKKIKDNLKTESGFNWLEKISEDTSKWIDGMNKANTRIASKTHHAGLKNDFMRYEAESIYLTTLSLLNYIGHIKE